MKSSAQSVVELALVTPILVVLAVGVLEVGRLVGVRIGVEGAAREAAFFASTRLAGQATDQEIWDAAAQESTGSHIAADAAHVTVSYPAPDIVLVTVRSLYTPLVPLPPALVGTDPIWVTGSAAFPIIARTPTPGGVSTRPPLASRTPTESPLETATPTPAALETTTPTPTASAPLPTATGTPSPTAAPADQTP